MAIIKPRGEAEQETKCNLLPSNDLETTTLLPSHAKIISKLPRNTRTQPGIRTAMDPDHAATSPASCAASSSSSSSLIFLGTGCSGALPDARCLTQPSTPPCAVCSTVLSLPPDQNPNYRCNTSLLIDYCHDDGTHKYILIDVGKTFREQVILWFVRHKVPSIDSIILTHEHADAVLGLDDLWMVQPSSRNDIEQVPIFLTRFTMDSVATRLPYLVEHNQDEGDQVARAAQLSWRIIKGDVDKPFVSSGLELVPLPVRVNTAKCHAWRGLYLFRLLMFFFWGTCLGFLFGRRARVAYLSDVSRILPRTEHEISKCGAGQLDLLILETNTLHGVSLDAVKRICPKRALLIGMNHEFEHYRENQMLAEWSLREGIPVQLAHDGQRIFIDL
ncbi:hypothetical protein EJB05_05441, partial [Eragrostis curvula]